MKVLQRGPHDFEDVVITQSCTHCASVLEMTIDDLYLRQYLDDAYASCAVCQKSFLVWLPWDKEDDIKMWLQRMDRRSSSSFHD